MARVAFAMMGALPKLMLSTGLSQDFKYSETSK